MRNNFSKIFLSSVLMLSVPLLAGSCIQPVDPNATKDVPNVQIRNEDFTPITTIEPTDRPIQLAPEDEEKVTADPCEKTKSDKDDILKVYCGGCHDQGASSSGVPKFDFVLDETRLVTDTIPRDGQPPQAFVSPGAPAQSLVYTMVATRLMPPPSRMIGVAEMPAPTLSDISVLADWITNCAPGAGAKPASGTGGSSGTGGVAGTGGSPGTGGNRGGQGTGGAQGGASDAGAPGTGGSTGVDAGVTGTGGASATDGGTGTGDGGVLMACANNVANGAACTGQPSCRMGNLTCTCGAPMNGARRWACR